MAGIALSLLGVACGGGNSTTTTTGKGGAGGSPSTGGSSSTGGTAPGSGGTRTGGTSTGGVMGTGGSPTGGGQGTAITSIDGSKTVGTLSAAETDQLCKDAYAYFGKTISPATLCKGTGLVYTISSSPIDDPMMQGNCKDAEAACLRSAAYVPSCQAFPSGCKVTVAQYSTCIVEQAPAYTKNVAALPECPVVTSADKPAIWEFVTNGMPESCTQLTDKCATLDLPTPRPGKEVSGAGGAIATGGSASGGRPATGGATSSGGTARTGGVASTGGVVGTGGVSGTGGRPSTGGAGSGGIVGTGGASVDGGTIPTTSDLPGDVAKAAGTPFVAAHSMTRALFAAYKGPLFKALRSSDSQEKDIGMVASGLVDAAALKTFCTGTTCKLTTLYDQSGNGNDMWRGDIDTNRPSDNPSQLAKICDLMDIEYWQMADGTQIPIALEHGWETAGGMWKDRGQCLRNRNKTKNMPVGASPQTTYAVFHGKYVNGGCCFNYGNTGKAIHYTGPGTLSALTYSKMTFWSKGTGNGPWPMVDWETGVYTGNTAKCGSGVPSTVDCTSTGENPNPTFLADIVNVLFKHDGTKHWAVKAGNAKTGNLAVHIDLPTLPKGYSPLKQEGGLGLGEGGAGDSGGSGGFSEGAVMAGETSDATDNAIQKSVVSVYGK